MCTHLETFAPCFRLRRREIALRLAEARRTLGVLDPILGRLDKPVLPNRASRVVVRAKQAPILRKKHGEAIHLGQVTTSDHRSRRDDEEGGRLVRGSALCRAILVRGGTAEPAL